MKQQLIKPYPTGPLYAYKAYKGANVLCTFNTQLVRAYLEGPYYKELKDGVPKDLPAGFYYELLNIEPSSERAPVAKVFMPSQAEAQDVIKAKFGLETVYNKCLYEVQYVDYEPGQWTVPCILTKQRADKILADRSVRKIKLIFDRTVLELDII